LHDVIPGVPPKFEHGAFGEVAFGDVPPPPPGFPPFLPPPEFIAAGGADFASLFGQGPVPPGDGSSPPGVGPNGELLPPPGLPPEFFAFNQSLADIQGFLADSATLPPTPPPGSGPLAPGDGQLPPGEGPVPQDLAFVPFDQIAEFLPPDFPPPDEAIGRFNGFGADHPLIGEDGNVNPDLESALNDRPPVPEGFDGFDFNGDSAQFDDLFTVYDDAMVGKTVRGQVNTTFSDTLDDGTPINCSDTTVIETVLGEATPMVQMGEGVFQTQWVVNIRQLTNSSIDIIDPVYSPDGKPLELTRESLSQMTWTMVFKQIDTDGDGVSDEMQVTGSNTVKMLDETVDGEMPVGLPPLPPPPELLLPLDFEGVLDLGGAPAQADGGVAGTP